MKIFLKQQDFPKESLRDFIHWYFDNDTPSTYHEDGAIQCRDGTRRSFSDILNLCKTYFDCEDKEVAKIILDKWKTENGFDAWNCGCINKLVFRHNIGLSQVDRFSKPFDAPRNSGLRLAKDFSPDKEYIGIDNWSLKRIHELANQ